MQAVSEPGETTAYLAAATTALSTWYRGPSEKNTLLVDDEPRRFGSRLAELMYTGCDFDELEDGIDEVTDIFTPATVAAIKAGRWDELEPWATYLRDNSITSGPIPKTSQTPFLFLTSELDTVGQADPGLPCV